MNLYFQGHDSRFAVEQILLTLYPEERPVYVTARDQLGDNGAAVTLSRGARRYTAVTVLYRDGAVYRGSASGGTEFADELERTSELNQLLKRSFYRAAVAQSGQRPPWGMLTGIRPAKLATKILERGGSPAEADRMLRDRCFVTPFRRRLCIQSAQAGLAAKTRVREGDISLYVGIPFCPTRCAYCSFVSNSVEKSAKLVPPYLEALSGEIAAAAELTRGLGLRVKTVYFGGGTPTTLSAAQLDALQTELAARFDLSGLEEYTVEAGRPDTVDPEKLAVLRSHGVTRVSINPQTMSDRVLELIGRRHSAADVLRAYEQARAAGFDCINMDLIAGLPGDDLEGFRASLDTVRALEPENITVHTLALKKGSRLRYEGGGVPGAETVGAMLDYGWTCLEEDGFVPYYLYRQKFMAGNFENVGWSRPGKECLYNIYIMEELHTILSLGAGGTTKLVDPVHTRIERIFNPKYPYEYIQGLEKLNQAKGYLAEFYDRMKGTDPCL